MIKIGDFSSLFQVSVKTIRYYEEIGLLIPCYVDIYSGYRYFNEENIIMMQNILTLKKLGFFLEEIKNFDLSSLEEKIKDYQKEIVNLQEKIKNLKQFSIQKGKDDLKMVFINDERVIGKWELLGISDNLEKAKNEEYIDDDFNIKELYLLPNGEAYWVISWTKDTIFINNRPCHYELVDNKLYVTITNPIDSKETKVVVYKNIDNKKYTLEEIKIKDDINISFVSDNRVLGKWKSIDFVRNKNSFNPNHLQTENDMLVLDELIFLENGIVNISYKNGKKFETKYTKDYVTNLILPDTLCKYEYINHLNKKYILIEWKSGDYVFGKVINGYYVLEKED